MFPGKLTYLKMFIEKSIRNIQKLIREKHELQFFFVGHFIYTENY